jgi:hypothetical protein
MKNLDLFLCRVIDRVKNEHRSILVLLTKAPPRILFCSLVSHSSDIAMSPVPTLAQYRPSHWTGSSFISRSGQTFWSALLCGLINVTTERGPCSSPLQPLCNSSSTGAKPRKLLLPRVQDKHQHLRVTLAVVWKSTGQKLCGLPFLEVSKKRWDTGSSLENEEKDSGNAKTSSV